MTAPVAVPAISRAAPDAVLSDAVLSDAVADVPARPRVGVLAPFADPIERELSAASLAAEDQLPGRRTASSHELRWRSILVKAYAEPEQAETFTTATTPDLLLVINLTGTFAMECQRAGGWTAAPYRAGVIGATAPGGTATLRWRSTASPEPPSSVHLHLSSDLLRDTAAELGSPGVLTQLPDALLWEDPFVLAAGRALLCAVEQRAAPLYGDSLAQALAVHLLCTPLLATAVPRQPADYGALKGVALTRVVDHMHEHLGENIDLNDLARVANISKFHFLRLFSQATGSTPHRYLVRLRMERAAEFMRTSEQSVLQVSAVCGYASPGQFATAFQRHHGASPTQYRRDTRS